MDYFIIYLLIKMEKTKKVEEIRHEILEDSIFMENYLNEEIASFFGFDAYKSSYYSKLQKETDLFTEFFLRHRSISNKFEIMKKIIKFIGSKLGKDFGKNVNNFLEIRNKIAHSFAPRYLYKEGIIGVSSIEFEINSNHWKDWDKKYNESKNLFKKILKELDKALYVRNPRRKRYRNFDEDEKQWLIKRYEKMIEDKKFRKNKDPA